MAVKEVRAVLTFAGGINARSRAADIDDNECWRGENFDLDGASGALRRRLPFVLVATAPNGQSINGYAQLVKRDGTISTLIQAGQSVYKWDGLGAFTFIADITPGSRIRGRVSHNWLLDQFVVITDLEKKTVVHKWDGTTFTVLPHDLGGDLYAKYCQITNERIILGNVKTTLDTPHVLLACKQSDATNWSNSDKPAAALAVDAPFFLIVPDFLPINGLENAFGELIFSTERGQLHNLTGASAKDFAITSFYQGSAISGDEAMANIGNDVAMGPAGRIESLGGTLNFGDVEADDISFKIAPLIESVTEWTIAYDRRRQRVFCFPNNQNAIYVLHKTVIATTSLSPWSKWTTAHNINFKPTAVMPIRNPVNDQDTVYMGDSIGRIYRIDGQGGEDGEFFESVVSVSVADGELTSPVVTGNVSYAVTTFTPKVIIFFSNRAAVGTETANYYHMFGFTTGATAAQNQCHCVQTIASSTSANIVGYNRTKCIWMNVSNSTSTGLAAGLVSFNTNGFTLDWTTVEATGRAIQWVAIGGEDLRAFAGDMASGTATTNLSETGVGFSPKLVLFCNSARPTTDAPEAFSATSDGYMNLGAMTSAAQWARVLTSQDNSADSETKQLIATNRCWIATRADTGAVNSDWAYVSMDADGFTVDRVDNVTDQNVSYLCLGGSALSFAVGTDTKKTSTGTQAKAGIGFRPSMLMLFGCGATSLGTMTDNISAFIGVATSTTSSRVAAIADDDDLESTTPAASSVSGFCARYASGATPTLNAEATLSSFDSDGYTLNWITSDSPARLFAFIALTASSSVVQTSAGSQLTVTRTSKLITLPDGDVFDAEGWIMYRRLFPATIIITLLHQGFSIVDHSVTLTLPTDSSETVYNGSAYYNGNFYYGFEFSERISKQKYGITGHSSAVQIKVSVTGSTDFSIEEVGIIFRTRA